MSVTLEHFLKTGQLGPLKLGTDPASVEAALGQPDARSAKLNPLMLKYGGLELTFMTSISGRELQLVRFAVAFHEPVPQPVRPDDWPTSARATVHHFQSFASSHHLVIAHTVHGVVGDFFVMDSGVRVYVTDGYVAKIELSRKESEHNRAFALTDSREPDVEQIRAWLDEANRALEAGVTSGGLLIAWAALEATLRRTALRAGMAGRIGAQPTTLVRELIAARVLSANESAFIETARQLRSAVAHGVTAEPVSADQVSKIIQLAAQLLAECERASS